MYVMISLLAPGDRGQDGHSRWVRQAQDHRHPLDPAGVPALDDLSVDLLLRTLALEVRHHAGRVWRGGETLCHQEEHGAQPGTVRRKQDLI